MNNGWSSPFFDLGRGLRQGCLLSPYVFILGAEILAIAVRKDTTIKEISIGNVECKLSQFADDTALILDGSLKSLQRSLYMLQRFGEIPGLRVKSHCLRKPGRAKRWGLADFKDILVMQSLSHMITNGRGLRNFKCFLSENDHPPRF